MTWKYGPPPESNYYLATWLRGMEKLPTVSELWCNVTTGWFSSRGYVDSEAGIRIDTVVAWMELPKPAVV